MAFWLSLFFPLLIGIAGWHYLFFSRAANRLSAIENRAANTSRIVFRRINGTAMILMAALLYVGTIAIDPTVRPRVFAATWLGVFVLLLGIIVLALLDMRLTVQLRRPRDAKEK